MFVTQILLDLYVKENTLDLPVNIEKTCVLGCIFHRHILFGILIAHP